MFLSQSSQIWEVLNDHPLAGYLRDTGKRRAILAMKIAEACICSPYQFIPAFELEDLIGFEQPNSGPVGSKAKKYVVEPDGRRLGSHRVRAFARVKEGHHVTD